MCKNQEYDSLLLVDKCRTEHVVQGAESVAHLGRWDAVYKPAPACLWGRGSSQKADIRD